MRLVLYIICFFAYHLAAQDTPVLSGYSINFETDYTFKNEITPIPNQIDGVDLYSRGQMGYKGNFSYQKRIGATMSLGGSLFIGTYPVGIKYNLKREYIGGLFDIATGPKPTIYTNYGGFNIGLNKFFKINKNLFSVGGKLGMIYFFKNWISQEEYSSKDGHIDPTFLVLRRLFLSNQKGGIIIAPELSLNYYKKLNSRLWLYFHATGTYSSATPIKGTYEVFGENETLTGDIKKRYAHVGLGAGIFFSKKIKNN